MDDIQMQMLKELERLNLGIDIAAGMDNQELLRVFDQTQRKLFFVLTNFVFLKRWQSKSKGKLKRQL